MKLNDISAKMVGLVEREEEGELDNVGLP